MGLNPISTTEKIKKDYTDYLSSMFYFQDGELVTQAKKILCEEGKFIKGPFIEITQPFITGKSIRSLMEEETLSEEFHYLDKSFPVDRNLYVHQEQAIKKVVEGRNIIVATGTGSGKTECFLLPIINELMREKEAGTLTKGTRALLLYPMNALANDQVSRLRGILKEYPDITFGRYTGETEETQKKAEELFAKTHTEGERIPNELISREMMRNNPPHILLTNYAMLEFLLLRPGDNIFFDGEYADSWKFIVLDEAHTYNGAKGTEISMLLQRLKQRILHGEEKQLTCIATSATLGGGKEAHKEVAKFAQDLFHEPFVATDIIESQRVDLTDRSIQGMQRMSYEYEEIRGDEGKLFELLKNDLNVIKLQQMLQRKSQLLSEVAEQFFEDENISEDEKMKAIVQLVDLCAKAKEDQGSMPLLPARYHVFVKALEGAYVALYRKRKLFLDRYKSYKLDAKTSVVTFELANCQRCGQEYIVGRTENETLIHLDTEIDLDGGSRKKPEYYMLNPDCMIKDLEAVDNDELVVEGTSQDKLVEADDYILCTACGHIEQVGKKEPRQCCKFPKEKYIKVVKVKMPEYTVNACLQCGNHSKNIVKPFRTADDPATEVLTRSLYQCIPPQVKKKEADDLFGEIEATDTDLLGRKLLIFSDSRQEAAFFASYLQNKYNNILWRKAIIEELDKLLIYEDINLDSLISAVVKYGKQHHLFEEMFDEVQKQKFVQTVLIKEFFDVEPQIGLEGLGLIGFTLSKPEKWAKLNMSALGIDPKLGLSNDELWELYVILFNSLRAMRATTTPELVSVTDKLFAPRNKPVYFKVESEKSQLGNSILGWMPKEKSSNKRLDYLKKLYMDKGFDPVEASERARKTLKELLLGRLYKGFWEREGYITETPLPKEGTVLQLNYKKWQVYKPKQLYVCEKCGNITHTHIRHICSNYRCDGRLVPYIEGTSRFSYYKDLYMRMKSIPLSASEHTAQLTSEYAARLQNKFEQGEINILSCSTTFEMGVDVGQLEAVFMRNVPPETANYIQRAGRAGRRTESTAFSLTYAKRRSHDLTYYQYPEKIIAGEIKAPYIELSNEKIVLRHVFSVVFAWFFKKYPAYYGYVDDFLKITTQEESAVILLKHLLMEQPKDLKKALEFVVPKCSAVSKYIGLDEWKWVDYLLKENEGVLIISEASIKETIEELEAIKKKLDEERKPSDSILRIQNTYFKKDILSFLSSNNVLPKYGFPVDVVDFDILNQNGEAKMINISRDLKLAISEFAPGSEIIANKRIWKPYALNTNRLKGWPVQQYAICKECGRLFSYHSDLGVNVEDKETMCCEEMLNYHYYVRPVFGFSTFIDAPLSSPGERRKAKPLPSRVKFDTYVDEDMELTDSAHEVLEIGEYLVDVKYSSRGKLVIINNGGNIGYSLCKRCGYITNTIINKAKKQKIEPHKTKLGKNCGNTFLHNVHLGHDFITDVVEIKLPMIDNKYMTKTFWPSLLYAIIEGASIEIGIARGELGGCLYRADEANVLETSIILYDNVPGGAGHAKKILQYLGGVLENALQKVSGNCGCGEETSCYGCLRSYENQFYHEILERGIAYRYLCELLNR